MLTVDSARQHLSEVRAELARLDKDREALLGLVQNYEDFLRARGESAEAVTHTPDTPRRRIVRERAPASGIAVRRAARRRRAKMSKRDAALKVIIAEGGKEIHAMDIARRIVEYVPHKLNPKHPYSSGLDYQLYGLMHDGLIAKSDGKNAWSATPAAFAK